MISIPRIKARYYSYISFSLIIICSSLYSWINIHRINHYHYLEWDLSIFGQGLWLLSNGHTPFVSIRDLNLFADHASYIFFLLTPLYAIVEDIRLLIIVQSIAIGITAWMLYKYALTLLTPWLALVVITAFLFYPALQYTWLEYFHPVVLALPFLVAVYFAIENNQIKTAIICGIFAMICKENVAVTIIALGIFALITRRTRIGLILIMMAALYIPLVLHIIIPLINPAGYQYSGRLYGDFANSIPEAILYLLNPANLWSLIVTEQNLGYIAALFLPTAFLPVGAPITLLAAAQLPMNLISSWPYAHQIHYHYATLVIPFVFLALIRTLAKLKKNANWLRIAAVCLMSCTVLGQFLYAPNWISPLDAAQTWKYAWADAKRKPDVDALIENIGPSLSVATHYRYLPHFVNRTQLYMYPNVGPKSSPPEAILIDMHVAESDKAHYETFNNLFSSYTYEFKGATSDHTMLFLLIPELTPGINQDIR